MSYKVNVEENAVYLDKDKVAVFDPKTGVILDYWNNAEADKRSILAAMYAEKKLNLTLENWSDGQIAKAKDIWELVPYAPDPEGNQVGPMHPEIYDWVEKQPNLKRIFEIKYKPFGRYSATQAGMGRNQTRFRDRGPGSRGVSPQSLAACDAGRGPLREAEKDKSSTGQSY